jgi:hypothetical protein
LVDTEFGRSADLWPWPDPDAAEGRVQNTIGKQRDVLTGRRDGLRRSHSA